jgi:hypothetical protein
MDTEFLRPVVELFSEIAETAHDVERCTLNGIELDANVQFGQRR